MPVQGWLIGKPHEDFWSPGGFNLLFGIQVSGVNLYLVGHNCLSCDFKIMWQKRTTWKTVKILLLENTDSPSVLFTYFNVELYIWRRHLMCDFSQVNAKHFLIETDNELINFLIETHYNKELGNDYSNHYKKEVPTSKGIPRILISK